MGNTPNIRFKGFTDDWEQRKLEDVVEFLDTMRKPLEGAKRTPGPYPYYGASGIVDYVDGYLFDEELVLLSEDGANITDRNYPVCFLASGKYWVNNHAHVLRTKDGNENNFICNSLERKDYKQYNSGMAMPKLNQEVCRSIPISCPSFDEQKKIGDYFRNLDNLITLHQRKCDETKELKKFMLQKMFPKNGEKKPEIRFEGFTDDWEQRKLGELVEFYNGDRSSRYPNDSDMVSEGVPFINAGDLVSGRVKLDTANKITEEKFNELSGAKIQRGDIIYCLRGTLGKNAFVDNFDVGTVASSLVDIRPKKVVGKYLYQVLNSDIEYTQRIVNDEGAAQPNLSAKNLSLFNIPMPDEVEQEKIAAYFDDLDNLITLHQRKCDEIKEIKKFMLQNMFPQKG